MLSFLMVAVVAAQPQPNCKDPQTQVDMNICASREYAASDAMMTRQYKMLAARMKQMDVEEPGYFAALLKSQRTWLQFRDAQCRFEGYLTRGGTAESLNASGCLNEATKNRTVELKSLLEAFGR